jgi:hypothetical protein
MNGKKIEEIDGSAIGMCIRSTSDIQPKDIRSPYIPLNWNDIRSIADITELCESQCYYELLQDAR